MLDKRNIINQAISTGSMVQIVYKDYHGRVTERSITPLEWVTHDKIRAFCHLRGAERDFRVDRIASCEIAEAKKKAQTHSCSVLSRGGESKKLAISRPVA